jgi:hypothetical protein
VQAQVVVHVLVGITIRSLVGVSSKKDRGFAPVRSQAYDAAVDATRRGKKEGIMARLPYARVLWLPGLGCVQSRWHG